MENSLNIELHSIVHQAPKFTSSDEIAAETTDSICIFVDTSKSKYGTDAIIGLVSSEPEMPLKKAIADFYTTFACSQTICFAIFAINEHRLMQTMKSKLQNIINECNADGELTIEEFLILERAVLPIKL